MATHVLFRPSDWTRRTVLFYVLFQGIHLALFGYGWYKQQADSRLAILNELKYSVWLSRGAGLALSLDGSLLVLPMCKQCLNFLRPKIRWIPLDESQWFHRQVAYSLLFYTIIHVSSHYVNFYNVAHLKLRPVHAVQLHYTIPGGLTGHIMILCMLFMFTAAHAKIRRQSYEGFWYIHHLFIVFYLALLTHGTGCFVRDSVQSYSPFAGKEFWKHCIGYQSFRWELLPVTIYIFERIFHFCQSRKCAKVLAVFRHPSQLIEIRFEKDGMYYRPGQWIFAKFPDIRVNQWHPFTISSCPEDPYISVHIQQLGDFTGTFADAFDTKEDHYQLTRIDSTGVQELQLKEGQKFPRLRVDGPYTSPAEDVFKNEIAVMVGAGIGVTPWASVLKSIWHLRNDPVASAKSRLKRLEFIWVCKDVLNYKWLHENITALDEQSISFGSQQRYPVVRSRIFITRPLNPLRPEKIPTRVVDRCSWLPPYSTTEKHDFISKTEEVWYSKAGSATITAAEFQSETNQGRPDFTYELSTLARELVNERSTDGQIKKIKAGVYYCGPEAPGKALRNACKKLSQSGGVDFKFWKEHG